MKFGKYLASRQLELPEYSGHFINYKALKKLIKQLATPTIPLDKPLSQVDIQNSLKENKAIFFFKVERELDKVNSFYLEKQANLAINLDLLLVQRNELFNNIKRLILNKDFNDSDSLNSNFRNSITYLNLYQNFKKIHQDLLRLQQFIELNETGFSKVVKKWDKRSKSHTKELFISKAVNVQPVFHKNEINELSDLVTSSLFDLETIIDGDLTPIKNFNPSNKVNDQLIHSISSTSITEKPSKEQTPELVNDINMRNGSISGLAGDSFHSRSYSIENAEIDELYSSFVNIATIKDPELSLLTRWIDKVRNSAKVSITNQEDIDIKALESSQAFQDSVKSRFSRVFLLSITNLKISDAFLKTFLETINDNIDILQAYDNFNNNKSILHSCCSIPSSSTQESSMIINNGIKVVKSTDLINHSRLFIVEKVLQKLNANDSNKLLILKDFNGRNCLHYASQHNRTDLLDIIVKVFPKNHLDDLDNESMSPLLLAIKHEHYQIIKLLVENGCVIYPETNDDKLQYLPINYACKTGDFETVKYLLSANLPNEKSINNQDVEGLSPLHVVARSGHHFLIKLLVERGADINQIDSLNKWPPLFYAALEGNIRSARELLQYGAKIDIVDEDGYNVLYYCVVEGNISVLNELLTFYSKITGEKNNASDIIADNIGSHQSKFRSVSFSRSRSKVEKEASMAILNDEIDSEDSASISGSNRGSGSISRSGSGGSKNSDDKNIDTIPDLQLPPPILPLRRYGHNFLEQKVLIELVFPNNSNLINLFNATTDLKPGRITLSSSISDIVPRNIILPAADETRVDSCIFQTDIDSLTDFRIDFEIFPKFGTRLIAKTTALSFATLDTSSPEINSIRLPLFDLRLKNIGELKFNCQVIFPFGGVLLEASKFDTYWKSSTTFVKKTPTTINPSTLSPNAYLSPSSISNTIRDVPPQKESVNPSGAVSSTNELVSGSNSSSFVTATSLSGSYLRIKICLLNDGTPVVCPNWSIAITDTIDLYLPNLSLEQLTSITDNLFDYDRVLNDLSNMTVKDISLIKKLLKIIYLPLELILQVLDNEINLNLEIIFPSEYEIRNLPFISNVSLSLNNFIDFTLNDIFNHLRSQRSVTKNNRSIIFMSPNSLICKVLNWKQPNFPVFLVMNGITYSNENNIFESRSTNGFLLVDEESNENQNDDDADIHEKNTNPDKLIENDQEQAARSIKDAVNFAVGNNLIGLITSIHLLRLVPKLIPLIRSRGLILVATNDSFQDEENNYSSRELDTYTKTEINGLRFDDVLTFKDDITM